MNIKKDDLSRAMTELTGVNESQLRDSLREFGNVSRERQRQFDQQTFQPKSAVKIELTDIVLAKNDLTPRTQAFSEGDGEVSGTVVIAINEFGTGVLYNLKGSPQ